MNMKRVFLVWLLLVSAIILVDLSAANPTNNNSNVKNRSNVAAASVTVAPNVKLSGNPVRGTVGGMQLGSKTRRPIIFGTISRDEWLAKEYFGYLCAPNECINEEVKTEITEKCFDPYDKLKKMVTTCFGQTRKCAAAREDAAMTCVIREAKLDPQIIPLTLHDCVDERITMKDWKCIRRSLMDKLKNVMELFGAKAKGGKDLSLNSASNVTIFDI